MRSLVYRHFYWRWTNLDIPGSLTWHCTFTQSTLTRISQLLMVQIKTTAVSFTDTCITSLQQKPINLQKLFTAHRNMYWLPPQGCFLKAGTQKLCGWTGISYTLS